MTKLLNEISRRLNMADEALIKDTNKFIELVKLDCKPWLRAIKGCTWPVAARGLNIPVGKNFILNKGVRSDREPKDTGASIHARIDTALNSMFGWRGRSSGLFATGNLDTARDYGKSYLIFPTGPFKFIWSAYWDDFIEITYKYAEDIKYSDNQELIDFLKDQGYTDKDLCKALGSGNEVMIRCKAYHAMAVNEIRYFLSLNDHKGVSRTDAPKIFIKEFIL